MPPSCVQVFRDVTGADISAMCFDDRQRKIIVGDSAGAMKARARRAMRECVSSLVWGGLA